MIFSAFTPAAAAVNGATPFNSPAGLSAVAAFAENIAASIAGPTLSRSTARTSCSAFDERINSPVSTAIAATL